jgi:hypothetical protein
MSFSPALRPVTPGLRQHPVNQGDLRAMSYLLSCVHAGQ